MSKPKKEKAVDPLLDEDQKVDTAPEEGTKNPPEETPKVPAVKEKPAKPTAPVETPKVPAVKEKPAKPTAPVETPKVPAKMTPAAYLEDSAAKTKAILDAGPHTMFLIPLAPGEKVGAYEVAELNGHKITVKKGCMVNIPVPFAEIFAKHYQIEMTAGQNMRIDRDKNVQDALS